MPYMYGVGMARYKDCSYDQGKIIPVYFKDQIIPASFEYALNQRTSKIVYRNTSYF